MAKKESKTLSLENSTKQAEIIKQINPLIMALDVEYLERALKNMRADHSMRESAAVLNPSPFTHNEQQDLYAAKIEQLSLMLKLSKNVRTIIDLQIKLQKAKKNSDILGSMFR